MLLLHRTAVSQTEVISSIDDALLAGQAFREYVAARDPFRWDDILLTTNPQGDRRGAVIKAAGMTWWVLQETASPV